MDLYPDSDPATGSNRIHNTAPHIKRKYNRWQRSKKDFYTPNVLEKKRT
jgi:hypothetical protein